jgi:uncharacterized protein YpuA (DUF1002 family)
MDFSDQSRPISFYIGYFHAFDNAHALNLRGANSNYYNSMLYSIEHEFLAVYGNIKYIADFRRVIDDNPKAWSVLCAENPYNALILAALLEVPDFEKVSNDIMKIGCAWEDARNGAEGHLRFERLKKHLIAKRAGGE